MHRTAAAFVVALVFGCFAMACAGLANPSKQILCPGALYCGSSSVPQTVSGGTCCVVVDLNNNGNLVPNATNGYLCAFGSSRNPAGCVATLQQARSICPNAPSVVLCTTE
jgi:hypothetical protein